MPLQTVIAMTPRQRFQFVLFVLLLAAVLALCGAAQAQVRPEVEVRGYARDLAVVSRSVVTDDPYLLNLARLRVQGLARAGPALRAEVWLDTEALAGSFLRTPEYALRDVFEPATWLDLEWTLTEGDRLVLRQRLFRAFVTADLGPVEATLGRQRVAWGTGFVWNPTDLLNPTSPTAIERAEREGVDAAYAALSLGPLSRAEVALAPGRRGQRAAAGRLSANVREFDLAVMGGHVRGAWVVGGDFAGYVRDSGLRGEAAYTRPEGRGGFVRAAVNADHRFPGDLYAFAELYHNGAGTRDRARYAEVLTRPEDLVFGLGREYAAASVTYLLSPLVNVGVYALANLNDASGLLGPTLTWSARESVEVSASAYGFLGAGDTEFGMQRSAVFASVTWFY
jgi:hypothetical protein